MSWLNDYYILQSSILVSVFHVWIVLCLYVKTLRVFLDIEVFTYHVYSHIYNLLVQFHNTTYRVTYALLLILIKGELTYGKIGEWRFDKRSYLHGPPPRNLSLPPPGVPESVVCTLVSECFQISNYVLIIFFCYWVKN